MRGILKRIGWTATNTQTKMLRSIASQALRHARPVISNFSVAAAGIAVGRFNMPRVVTGSNVETQNTADSIHAEESLVAKLRQGEQLTRVIILAGIGIPVAPCGSCREVLAAHSTPDAEALVQVAPGAEKWLKINDLLPTVSATPVPLANSSASVTRLFRQAEALLDTPYTPYVQRPRAAAVLTEQGHIFAASGREDAAFHHEHSIEVVLGLADANRERQIASLLFLHDHEDELHPCGRCRQKVLEASQVAGTDISIISASTSERLWQASIGQLLPHSFGPKDLGVEVSRFL